MSEIWTGVALLPRESVELRLCDMAKIAESSGLDGVWMGDHIALVEGAGSRYPYSADGSFLTDAGEAWYDWVVSLASLANCTEGLRLGVGVCVGVLRHPLVLAKQVATLDRLSGGRVVFGVGTGWLAEEFEALGVPFRKRGERTDAFLAVMRAAWTGSPESGQYGPYTVATGVHLHPTPIQEPLPILVAGDSPRSIRRSLTYGDGWITVADPDLTPIEVATSRLDAFRVAERGVSNRQVHVAVRVPIKSSRVGKTETADYLRGLVAHGATGLLFDVNWYRDGVSKTLTWLQSVVDECEPSSAAPVSYLGRVRSGARSR